MYVQQQQIPDGDAGCARGRSGNRNCGLELGVLLEREEHNLWQGWRTSRAKAVNGLGSRDRYLVPVSITQVSTDLSAEASVSFKGEKPVRFLFRAPPQSTENTYIPEPASASSNHHNGWKGITTGTRVQVVEGPLYRSRWL